MNAPKSRQALGPEQLKDELLPGQDTELLKELHILTREGTLNADTRRKLKQVNHLYRLLEPFLTKGSVAANPILVDLGAGKSYLGFILYDLFFKKLLQSHPNAKVIAVESRSELNRQSRASASKLGYSAIEFQELEIEKAKESISSEVTWTTALHACDTATDDAIDFALERKSQYIALVPCCQAALASEMKSVGGELRPLWEHPIHRREFGSHLTNVLRCLRLEAAGYKVTVTELVGWEHSLKNELILAERKGDPRPENHEKLLRTLERFQIPERWQKRFLSGTELKP